MLPRYQKFFLICFLEIFTFSSWLFKKCDFQLDLSSCSLFCLILHFVLKYQLQVFPAQDIQASPSGTTDPHLEGLFPSAKCFHQNSFLSTASHSRLHSR